jgi:putative alpha-1,2-mannosidase
MANEPDIAYPYLFNYVKGEEFRSQELVKKNYKIKNKPDGLPGNDDVQVLCRLGFIL